MPPFPWLTDRDGGKEFEDLLAYIQTLGRATDWRAGLPEMLINAPTSCPTR